MEQYNKCVENSVDRINRLSKDVVDESLFAGKMTSKMSAMLTEQHPVEHINMYYMNVFEQYLRSNYLLGNTLQKRRNGGTILDPPGSNTSQPIVWYHILPTHLAQTKYTTSRPPPLDIERHVKDLTRYYCAIDYVLSRTKSVHKYYRDVTQHRQLFDSTLSSDYIRFNISEQTVKKDCKITYPLLFHLATDVTQIHRWLEYINIIEEVYNEWSKILLSGVNVCYNTTYSHISELSNFVPTQWLQPLPGCRDPFENGGDGSSIETKCQQLLDEFIRIRTDVFPRLDGPTKRTGESSRTYYERTKKWGENVDRIHAFDLQSPNMLSTLKRRDEDVPILVTQPILDEFVHSKSTRDTCDSTGRSMKHQMSAVRTVMHDTTTDRLVLYHRVGAGKTYTLVDILDAYFEDPRTKLVICPNQELCDQFIVQMERRTKKYKKYMHAIKHPDYKVVQTEKGLKPQCGYQLPFVRTDGKLVFSEYDSAIEKIMPAPLLVWPAYYVEALIREHDTVDKRTTNRMRGLAMFEWPDRLRANLLDNMVILVDEAHTLYSPSYHRMSTRRLGTTEELFTYCRLRKCIRTAVHSRIVGATATLPTDRQCCLCPVCVGSSPPCDMYPDARLNPYEDFVYMMTGQKNLDGHLHMFPSTDPSPLFPSTDRVDQIPVYVDTKRAISLTDGCINNKRAQSYLRGDAWRKTDEYHNITCPSDAMSGDAPEQVKLRSQLLDDLQTFAPKLNQMMMAINIYISTKKNNIVVLCTESTGMSLLTHAFTMSNEQYVLLRGKGEPVTWYRHHTVDDKRLVGRNSRWNLFDQTWKDECGKSLDENPIRIVVLDTDNLSEGVDIVGIEQIIGVSSYEHGNTMEQAFGRADRMCRRAYFRHEVEANKLVRTQYVIRSTGAEETLKGAITEWTHKAIRDEHMRGMALF
jgi:superfamily II DNA or RNA helicase